ncbi:unnamed protein product [Spodoptera exigua]|nr:unnamed protein product [Spodoptera exigua]
MNTNVIEDSGVTNVPRWLVFCDQKLKLLSTAIISRFGLVFGFIIFGLIADSFGRRMAMILDVITELILGLVITFCDSEGWFRLVVFLRSLLGSASFFMGLILGVFTAGSTYTYKSTVSSILSSIALSSGLVAHALVLNITPRLFATNIRATAVGFCHATGQIGSIISYLLFLFHPISNTVIMVIELGVTLIIIGLLFIFPDVDQRELPDVMKDMDYFSELSKPLRWVTQKTNSPSLEEMEMRVYSFGSDGRRPSTSNVSEVSAPAQQIGFIRLSRAFINY